MVAVGGVNEVGPITRALGVMKHDVKDPHQRLGYLVTEREHVDRDLQLPDPVVHARVVHRRRTQEPAELLGGRASERDRLDAEQRDYPGSDVGERVAGEDLVVQLGDGRIGELWLQGVDTRVPVNPVTPTTTLLDHHHPRGRAQSAQRVGPDLMTDILAIGADSSLADLAYIWHTGGHPGQGAEQRSVRKCALTCGFTWWSLGDSNP